MKIVTWNCNGGFRNKFQKIATLEADIYVIQECENPEHSKGEYRKWAENYLWVGESKHKGMGIFASRSVKIQPLNWESNEWQLFLPVSVDNQFTLVGVWTKHGTSRTFRHIGQLWKYLELHKSKLTECHTVLCGDLNSNKIWDLNHDRRWNHSAVVRELSTINMVSLYHAATGEEQGSESTPTFYQHRNLRKPYHIDYAFSSKDMRDIQSAKVAVGHHTEWLEFSDHMPLIFTIKCELV